METVTLGNFSFHETKQKPVEIGEGAAKIICSISGVDAAELAGNLRAIDYTTVDLVEWRVDTLAKFDDAIIQGIYRVVRRESKVPIIATFRTVSEGGTGDKSVYTRVLQTLINAGVDAVDVEATHPQAVEIIEKATIRGVGVFFSRHLLNGTGKIEEMLRDISEMQTRITTYIANVREQLGEDDPAHIGKGVVKYVVTAGDDLDALKLMLASRHFVDSYATIPVVTLAMGEKGRITRLFPATSGSAATFTSVNGVMTAAGQIDHSLFKQLNIGL